MLNKDKVQFENGENNACYICVNSYAGREPKGVVYSAFIGKGKEFRSTMDMLDLISQLINGFNEDKTVMRNFGVEIETSAWEQAPFVEKRSAGDAATFKLDIIFRQGNDWQGKIHWLEEDKEECFRSGLEMLRLIDSALRTASGGCSARLRLEAIPPFDRFMKL